MFLQVSEKALGFLFGLSENRKYRHLAKYNIGDGFRRIYLYHIQKTGGTSMNHMFLSRK
jgi:hypothetical protein